MIPKPLNAQERAELITRMDEEEKKLQEELGKNWEQLVQEYEQSVADTLKK